MEPAGDTVRLIEWGEARYHLVWFDRMFRLMDEGYLTHIVAEQYIQVPGKVMSHQPDALRQLGVLRWMSHHFGLPYKQQRVKDARDWATTERLQAVTPRPGLQLEAGQKNGGHGLMALRHALLFNSGLEAS